ncbi:MAG TPA: alpha/beta fold hydrolase, partial [Ktedonobacteraceae bacterium]
MSVREQEGFIPVGEYRVWYRIVGGGADHENFPLLTLHGGPGIPHEYITDMAALASDTRRVIFYDQLGCGRSDQPNNPSLWTIERTVAEIDTVRRALGLENVHLWGQSFESGLRPSIWRPTSATRRRSASVKVTFHKRTSRRGNLSCASSLRVRARYSR